MADLRIEFEMWLAERQESKNSPNFCVATIVEASRYAIEKSVSKCELFAITDHRLFNEIKSKLLGNKFFRIMRKSTYKAFKQVANLYVQFLKDLDSRKIVFETEGYEAIDKKQQIDDTYISEEDEAILPISKTNINNCKEIKPTLVAQIIDIVKEKGISGAWVDGEIFPLISATKRAVWDILNTNEELIEVPRGCFVFKDEIMDLDEARELILKILRGHFSRNNGVSTSKILYKAVQAQLPVFLNDNDFDDEEKVYCISKYLYSKCGTEQFGFYMNQYIFENESNDVKSIFGLLVRLAQQDGGFLTVDDAKNYLARLELSDNLTQCLGLNLSGKRDFLQYTESEFLYFPSAQYDEEQIYIIGNKLDKLFAENPDDNFVILRDISDEWFGFLPALPCGRVWTPLLLQEVIGQFQQMGYVTIKTGLKQDLDTLHAAITPKSSDIKTFSELVWEFLYREGCIKEFATEDLRLKLRDAGIITGNELIYNMHSALNNDYRFVWRNGNTQVKVLER